MRSGKKVGWRPLQRRSNQQPNEEKLRWPLTRNEGSKAVMRIQNRKTSGEELGPRGGGGPSRSIQGPGLHSSAHSATSMCSFWWNIWLTSWELAVCGLTCGLEGWTAALWILLLSRWLSSSSRVQYSSMYACSTSRSSGAAVAMPECKVGVL